MEITSDNTTKHRDKTTKQFVGHAWANMMAFDRSGRLLLLLLLPLSPPLLLYLELLLALWRLDIAMKEVSFPPPLRGCSTKLFAVFRFLIHPIHQHDHRSTITNTSPPPRTATTPTTPITIPITPTTPSPPSQKKKKNYHHQHLVNINVDDMPQLPECGGREYRKTGEIEALQVGPQRVHVRHVRLVQTVLSSHL